MSPELTGILAVGATAIGLLPTIRRDTRADNQALRKTFHALIECLSRVKGDIEGLFVARDPRNDAS